MYSDIQIEFSAWIAESSVPGIFTRRESLSVLQLGEVGRGEAKNN